MKYQWKTVPTELPKPTSKQVLQLTNKLRLEIIQTQFRSETTDREYSAKLLYTSADNMQSYIWYKDHIPENHGQDIKHIQMTALHDAIEYIQGKINELIPTKDALTAALDELKGC